VLQAVPTAALDVPGTSGKATAGGYVDGRGIIDTGNGPHQAPQALLNLHFDVQPARWLRAHLELHSLLGGPFEGGHPGYLSLVHEFQNVTPNTEASEGYVEALLPQADVRVGVQKFAWGKLDGVPPTDVLNPRDFHDPLVDDFEERKIGIPAVLGTYYLPDLPSLSLEGLRATLIYVPIATAPRLALTQERWFPRSLSLGSSLPVSFNGRTLDVPLALRTRNDRPPAQFDDGGVALRIGGTWRTVDWDFYHYTGPETGPDADLISKAFLHADTKHPVWVNSLLRQTDDTIHMTGADAAASIGGVTMRAEIAGFQNRPYLRAASDVVADSLRTIAGNEKRIAAFLARLAKHSPRNVPLGDLFVDRDAIEWGVGADYLIHGFIPLVQVTQTALTEPAPRLLISNPETRFTLSLRKRLMAERLELELRGLYAVSRDYWFLYPRASYLVRDDLRVRVGYLAIGGPQESILGQFRQNDEFVFQVRYTF
jgi:hypothetical protein